MLYDVYKVRIGVYRIVGPYVHDDLQAHQLRVARESYVATCNSEDKAHEAAQDDHVEGGNGGGIVCRTLSVALAETEL
jgi:hypothetical protein